jgi:ketosteroid isomerase-like protein
MKIVTNSFMVAVFAILLWGCCAQNYNVSSRSQADTTANASNQILIGAMLDSFNVAAAKADYTRYFNFYTEDAIFIGTDATEHWDKANFMVWAKPFFDKKRTWNFRSIQRHIYFGKGGDIAWFDELLSTQMKICRGSGVVVKQNNEWKVQQYVLSMTIPNSQTKQIIKLKAAEEDSIITKLSGNR